MIAFGGYSTPPATYYANTEYYNGTSWSELNDLNTARRQLAGAGLYTSALAFGGETSPGADVANTEEWNGASWAEVADLPAGRVGLGGAAANNTAALAFGGNPGYSTDTNEWNDTSFSTNTITTD
jgi:hypothetical protein